MLLLNMTNYYSVKAPYTKVLAGIHFNAPKFLVTITNIHGAPVNHPRAQRYDFISETTANYCV